MWKCKCGESHEDSFDSCWNCGADRVAPAQVSAPRVAELSNDARDVGSGHRNGPADRAAPVAVINRYNDAYLVAIATAGVGSAVKVLGVGLGAIIALIAILTAGQHGGIWQAVGGILLGVVIGSPIYVLGVLVAAHAQTLVATLDTAVHSSPFLTKQDMARIMSL